MNLCKKHTNSRLLQRYEISDILMIPIPSGARASRRSAQLFGALLVYLRGFYPTTLCYFEMSSGGLEFAPVFDTHFSVRVSLHLFCVTSDKGLPVHQALFTDADSRQEGNMSPLEPCCDNLRAGLAMVPGDSFSTSSIPPILTSLRSTCCLEMLFSCILQSLRHPRVYLYT
jgi:hypothetical protein